MKLKQAYKKGKKFEYQVMEELRRQGHNYIMRSAGSHGIVDIIALNTISGKGLFIQCKTRAKKKEIEELHKEGQFLNGVYKMEFIVFTKYSK